MAKSIYIVEGLNAVASIVPRIAEDKAACIILNNAVYEIWRRYDWKEFGKILEPFWLISGVQDYPWAIPFTSENDNTSYFWGLQKAHLVRVAPEPAEVYPLKVIRDLDLTHMRSIPHAIGWSKSRNSIRVYPCPIGGVDSPQFCVKGEYKVQPIKMNAAGLYGYTFPWDDIHFGTFCEVLKWKALEFTQSPAADAQRQRALWMIDRMAEDEGVAEGDAVVAPASGLALGGTTSIASSPFYRMWW